MRVNQEDRPGVSDLPPPEVKKKVEKLTKRKLEDVLEAIPPIKKSTYQPIQIEPRDPIVNLPESVDTSPIGLFFLFVTPQLLNTIAEQTNEKAKQFYDDKETTSKERPWKTTTGTEIGGFLGVLLMTGLYKLPNTESYWNIDVEKPILLPIQRAFSLIRWEQIKRFLRISPHDPDFDSRGSN